MESRIRFGGLLSLLATTPPVPAKPTAVCGFEARFIEEQHLLTRQSG